MHFTTLMLKFPCTLSQIITTHASKAHDKNFHRGELMAIVWIASIRLLKEYVTVVRSWFKFKLNLKIQFQMKENKVNQKKKNSLASSDFVIFLNI